VQDRTPNVHVSPAPRLAKGVLFATLTSFLVIMLLNAVDSASGPVELVCAAAALAVSFVLQLRHSEPGARHGPARGRVLTLSAQFVLAYTPIALFEVQWGAMAGFLAGSLLLLVPGRYAWPLYGAAGASILVIALLQGRAVTDSIYLGQSTLLTGVVVFGLSRLVELVEELNEARGEVARIAVITERLRFSRDLHDLLGYSLSAITLKCELIVRLVPVHPERALDELKDVLVTSRQSLADVRRLSSGLRAMSLAQEVTSAKSLLTAADVRTTVVADFDPPTQDVDTVMAAVLREAVTNLLRHSKVRNCTIEVTEDDGALRLTVENDGVIPSYRDASRESGNGLGNLTQRLVVVQGRLTAGLAPGGKFRVQAVIPTQSNSSNS
jgi:two-component system, NarL family, sensor histidine kinase DesK